MAEANRHIPLEPLLPFGWFRFRILPIEFEPFGWDVYEHLKKLSNESDIIANINEISWLPLAQIKSQLLFLSVGDKNLTLARIIMKMEDCYTLVTPNKQTSTIVIACQNEYEDVVQLLFSKPFYYQLESELRRLNLMQFDDLISEMNSKLLHQSIQNNKPGIVNILINNGVTLINQTGVTALHLACEHNQLTIVRLLVQKGVSLSAKTNVNGYTPLHLAVISNATEIVEFLLNKRANVDAESTDNVTPLHLACTNNCKEVARVLIVNGGASVNAKTNVNGYTPIHLAAISNAAEIAEFLLNNGASVEAETTDSVTPLHLACTNNNIAVARALVVNGGASLNAKTNVNGYTQLHLAVISKETKIVKFLLNKGANIDAEATDNVTPLHLACTNNCSEVARVLMWRGANATIKTNSEGLTPLHCACKFEYFDVALIVLVENARRDAERQDLMNIADRSGVTSFHLICENAREDIIIDAIDDFYADLNKSNEVNGQYPLHYACIRGDNEIISAMLNRGADIDSQDNEGNTTLHIACREENEAIIKTLLMYLPNKTLKNKEGRLAKALIKNQSLRYLFDKTYILPYYRINRNSERGYCLIINIQHFSNNQRNPPKNRDGSDIDRDRLKSTFESLRYKVLVHNDLNKIQIKSEMQKLARIVRPDDDSVVVCLLSHGRENAISASNGEEYEYKTDILKNLGPRNCPALKLKPKIVIVQACRGNSEDVVSDSVNVNNQIVPTQSDFLFLYSTVPGFVAWRKERTGSPFIQTLCKCILQFHKDEHIVDIFTKVNELMSGEIFQPAPNKRCTAFIVNLRTCHSSY